MHDKRLYAESRTKPQHRPDIMRVCNLVKHEDKPVFFGICECFEVRPFQRGGFYRDTLVHSVARDRFIEDIWQNNSRRRGPMGYFSAWPIAR